MGLLSKTATLRHIVYHGLRHFRPLKKALPLLIQSIIGRLRRGTWRHRPHDLELTLNQKHFPFRTNSLGQAANTIREAIEHYTPPTPLPSKPIILDCGGNQGISTLYFKTLHPDATIHVFEPSPEFLTAPP